MVLGSLLLAAQAWGAEVQTNWERNEPQTATAAFRFETIPSPSRTDAATDARWTIASGEADPNGGDLDVLRDGYLPRLADQPDTNFFFAPGTAGGRLVVDLGRVAELDQVNTYSWHPRARGPQVYRLYASDGSAAGFDLRSVGAGDPEPSGWTRIAAIDTRPEQLAPGGQYGVSISAAGGGKLGAYRYLLFDVSRTDDRERFSNTFFSEIDVHDGQEHAAEPRTCEIVFDVSEVPELQAWVDSRLRPICERWYPMIVELLPSEGFTAPRRTTITFKKEMQGVASTSGTRIQCAGRWFQRNLEGEAAGAVVHELVHVVQQYGRTRGGNPNPGWLVEGVADYIRWFLYEPVSQRPRPNPARAHYTDSYRVTAAFLHFVTETHDKDIVRKLNAAMREGRYTPELWTALTGKTIDDLWAYMKLCLDEQ
jgi:hypothetical protein